MYCSNMSNFDKGVNRDTAQQATDNYSFASGILNLNKYGADNHTRGFKTTARTTEPGDSQMSLLLTYVVVKTKSNWQERCFGII